jgi:hypothetical protein
LPRFLADYETLILTSDHENTKTREHENVKSGTADRKAYDGSLVRPRAFVFSFFVFCAGGHGRRAQAARPG